MSQMVPATAFARPLKKLNLERGPGIPALKGGRRPWEGLSSMISETIGPIGSRRFGPFPERK